MYNYTERYDEVDLENLPQRGRRQTMRIEDPEKGLLTTSNIPVVRSSSVGAQNQKKEGTCYAYTATRLITRLITKKFPDDFEVNDEEFSLIYHGKNGEFEDNCYLDKSINLNKVRDMLTINKCSITKQYNHLLLFCYTLFTIKKKFGCSGYSLEYVLIQFEKDIRKFYQIPYNAPVFSPELDSYAFEKFIRPLMTFNYPNKNFEVKTVFYNLNNNSPERNWILNFPEPAKRALKNKMYVSFVFFMPENQWETINVDNIFDSNPIIRDTSCVYPLKSHAVTITDWEQEEPGMPAYITILNSWGKNWGDGGFIRISSENYYKFLLSPFCKEYEFDGNLVDPENNERLLFYLNVEIAARYKGLQFTYFKVADDKPFVTAKTEPELESSTLDTRVPNPLGGKSKKRKTIKRKTIKRKTRKSKKSKKR
jgi:hypothetical protein